MKIETCNAIRTWVQQGGILLGFGAPSLYDEFGARKEPIALADVFGADIARMRVPGLIRPDNLETSHPEGAYTDLPPLPYRFNTNLAAGLKPLNGEARAWWVGQPDEAAVNEDA